MSFAARPLALYGSNFPAHRRGTLTRLFLLLLVMGGVAACVDDAPTEPSHQNVQLAISARVMEVNRSASYRVEVHASYRRTGGELVELVVSPQSPVAVGPGTSTDTLSVEIGPCLADPQREEPLEGACRLVIRLHLLDEGGAVVATANQDAPDPVRRGASVTLDPIELTPLPAATPIILDPVVVDFATTADATTIPGSKTVTISTSPGGTLTGISVGSITYRPSGIEWLQPPQTDQASATNGAPATLTLQPLTTALPPGDYSATILVTAASGASNSPQTVTANYRVEPASAPPTLVLTPSSLTFGPVPRSASSPEPQQVTIQSSTGAALGTVAVSDTRYDPSDVAAWLSTTLEPSGAVLTLVPATTDLGPGTYTATVTISSSVTGVVPQSVRVTYVVQPPTPAPPSRLTIALRPTTLLVGQTTEATATVTDENGTVFASLPAGAVITWASSDPTVMANPTPSSPLVASGTALRAGTTTVDAKLTLPDRTTIASNAVQLLVNARRFALTIRFSGDGAGTVTSLETPTPLIQCTWNGASTTGTCTAPYPEGEAVSLRAAPQANSSFDGWGEACAGVEGEECRIVMQEDQVAAAAFTLSRAGAIAGIARNALNASPVPFAKVELRVGADVTDGTPLDTTLSAADGSYRFSQLPAGTYTIVARADGYIDGKASEIVVSGDEVSNRDIILSPTLPQGESRIILTWGDSPPDLDAHLTGPGADGSRFHVFYDAKGSLRAEPFAFLDIDDRNAQGPETVTIAQQRPGVYRFSVHDYSNRTAAESFALAASGAHVQVLQGDRLVAQFDVPNEGGTLWTVFELDGTTITPVNTMTYAIIVENSVGTRNAPATDASIIRASGAAK